MLLTADIFWTEKGDVGRFQSHKTGTTPIRVLIDNIPHNIVQPLLQFIRAEPDMLLVAQVRGNASILLAVATGVDVLILGAHASYSPPGICSHLLSEFPDLRILVLSLSGGPAIGYWRGLRSESLNLTTPTMLVQMLRRLQMLNPTM